MFRCTTLVLLLGLLTVVGCAPKPCPCDPCTCSPCEYKGPPAGQGAGAISAAGPELNGEQIACDMPASEHLRNKGGSDGAGLCVFTSIDHCARWANEPALIGFRDFMTKYPGGGYPEKVDKYIPSLAKSKGLPEPAYIQHTGGDPKFLDLAMKTGRMVAVTYAGSDGVFYSGPIAHMVNLVYLSDKSAVILDNNYPDKYLWMSRDDFLKRWKAMGGGWAFVLLKAGPPPVPTNWTGQHASDWSIFPPRGRTVVGQCSGPIYPHVPAFPPFYPAYPPPEPTKPIIVIPTPTPPPVKWPVVPAPEKKPAGKPAMKEPDDDWKEVDQHKKDPAPAKPSPAGPFDPPSPTDPAPPPTPREVKDHGVMSSLVEQKETWRYCGQKVDRDTANMILANQLVDDSTLYRLTINMDDEALRKRIVADLNTAPELAGWRAKVLVQDYPTTHWAVAGVGHQPGIILQPPPTPDGKAPVLFRMESYTGPAQLAEALRKADDKYNPKADPDPAKPAVPALKDIDLGKVPTWVWVLLAGGGLFVWQNKKSQTPK